MRTIHHTAIVIKSSDYSESDKLIRLFTVDGGILQARISGVKKSGAKLKFAAQPFSFCEYTLTERGGFYKVTGAVQLESLYALSLDPDRYTAAALMAETVDHAVSTLASPALFVYLLKLFSAILYQDKDPFAAAALWINGILKQAGYGDGDRRLSELTPQTLPEVCGAGYLHILKQAADVFENRFAVKLQSLRVLAQSR